MVLWAALALMTGAAVLTVLWPLSNERVRPAAADGGDVGFYKDQLAEIERDRARGALAEADAEAARIEAGRRLLRAQAAGSAPADPAAEPSLRRRRAASALALSVVPIVGLAVYGALGSPHLAGQAAASRAGPGEAGGELASALARVERHLAANPGDAKGWDLVAPIYVRLGRFDDAARAFAAARRAGGDTADRLSGEGEALSAAAGGGASPEARALFQRALALEPASPRARFNLAALAEGEGDREGAARGFRELLADAPADAPWTAAVRARLSRLDVAALAETLPAEAVPSAVAGMVGGLDARLAEKGGSEAEWARLVRSLAVLGRREDALDRLRKAKAALAGEPDASGRLDRLAAELGLVATAER